jgi:hypothetical protein
MYVQAIANTTGKIPDVCGFGAAAYAGGRVAFGGSADTQSGAQIASGANIFDMPFGGGFGLISNITFQGGANGNIAYQLYALNGQAGLEIGTNNGNLLTSVQSVSLVGSLIQGYPHNLALYANVSSMGDPGCH